MAPELAQLTVSAALLHSRARLQRAQALPGGVWLAHWHNADTEAVYLQPTHHTLSFYLAGGHAVRCHEAPDARGEPGVLCLLPAGHDSRWDVNGALQLLHLYLPRLDLAQTAERWFDLDPRLATLADQIYFRDERLAALCGRIAMLDWQATDAPLQLQQLVLDTQAHLLEGFAVHRRRPLPTLRGGLAPAARRRVLERIEGSLDAPGGPPPSLAALAEAACLSEYHFARMFKASFGCSPHAWVMQRRIERARALLADGRHEIDEVARHCGYAHLSHLNAALRRAGLASAGQARAIGLKSTVVARRPPAGSC
jgi:AraC family transcriptional regulator